MTRWPTWPAKFRFAPMHEPFCREERVCFDRLQYDPQETTNRQATELEVPVPSVRDALGQHHVARVLRRAGYQSRAPYQKEA